MAGNPESDRLDEAEVARRSEATLKRLLATPHKKQADMNAGKAKTRPTDAIASDQPGTRKQKPGNSGQAT